MQTPPTTRYQMRRQANSHLQCNAPRCYLPRYGLEVHCRSHVDAARRYGHPSAGPLKAAAVAPYLADVRKLWSLPANAGHEGLLHAQAWADSLLAKGAANRLSFAGASELQRLIEAGITGRQVIEAVVGTALYLLAQPAALPSDRARDFAGARAAFMLAPQRKRVAYVNGRPSISYGKPRRSSLIFIGKELRINLAGLVALTRQGVEAMRAKASRSAAEVEAARSAPFAS